LAFKARPDDVREQIRLILIAWGMSDDLAETTAHVMTQTDLIGVDSHGISMLMTYEKKRAENRFDFTARPRIVRENAVAALMDAGGNLGHPVSVAAMELAIKKARETAVGVVSVRNSHHFGAAGYYAKLAADEGLVGWVASGARGITVVPTRASRPVLGTNPLAFAAPATRNRPFVLDMATSTVAVGKVKVYGFNNKPIPEGWVADGAGQPITDANKAYDLLLNSDTGGLTPVGGKPELSSHKGYGLGLMAHILGGVLSGGSFTPIHKPKEGPNDPENIGHCFMAIDPDFFRDEGQFEADLDDVIDYLHDVAPTDPEKPVLVAGDPEAETRAERLENGVPIPDALDEQLRDVCRNANVPYILDRT
jgi:LDH2 family malate/lactate/ureidoglycolate dehydrogenase